MRDGVPLPSVDVVIPTLNSAETIGTCLELIRAQDYAGDINIIIMDGGSEDNTIDICKRFKCEIHVEPGMYGTGLTGARNKSLDYCKSSLSWQVDSDNYIADKHTLFNLVQPFLHDDSINISVPLIDILPSQSGIDKWLAKFESSNIEAMLKNVEINKTWVTLDDLSYGITNCSLVRTEVIRKVGGYDSDIRVWARVRKAGLSRGAIVPSARYYHLQGQTLRKWIKKQERRIKLFGGFSKSQYHEYFVQESNASSHRLQIINYAAKNILFSLSLMKSGDEYWYYGPLMLAGFFLILIRHPYRFIRTFKNFL
ncbi:MAG: glycosyltransferase family 2 protein [Thermoplasmatales archaeon]